MFNAGSGLKKDDAGDTLSDAINASFDELDEKAYADGETNETTDDQDEAGEEAADAIPDAEPEAERASAPEAEAPQHWPADRRQAFATATPEIRAAWLAQVKDLEAGFTRKSQELSAQSRIGEAIQSIFTPEHRALMAQSGGDELSTIKGLVQIADYARRDPAGYVKWYAGQAGLDLGQILGQTAGKQEPDELSDLFADPRVEQLTGKIGQIEQLLASQRAEQTARSAQASMTAIQNFEAAADENGLPRYPHFRAVAQTMGRMMESDPALAAMPDGPEKLQAAYDRAVWASPEIRQKLLDAEIAAKTSAAQAQRDQERARRAATARPSPGVAPASNSSQSLDDVLKEVLDQAGF